MRIIVIGATGTIGSAVADALQPNHDVVRASRSGPLRIDLDDPSSAEALFAAAGEVDAVICTAASAALTPLEELTDAGIEAGLRSKLLGQLRVFRLAVEHLADGGSVTLTAGTIPGGIPGSAVGALVNAGLEAFVRAAAPELPRGLRANVVSPGWIKETLDGMGVDSSTATPASVVAGAYVAAVEGTMQGQTIVPPSPASIA